MSIVEFNIQVENPQQLVALYDRIQVWRSDAEDGTYVDITADEAEAAFFNGTVEGPWAVSGLNLGIRLNGADTVTMTFTGDDPINLIDVLEQINAAYPGLVADEVPTDTGKIRLTSSVEGTQSSINVLGEVGAETILGIYTNGLVVGKESRLLLSANTEVYLFRDYSGSDGNWYKVRYYSSETGAVSDFEDPFFPGPGEGLEESYLVVGSLRLVDVFGAPVVGRRIIFVPVAPQVVDMGEGGTAAILPSVDRRTVTTDANGRAEAQLTKNQRLKVFIEGSTFQREFVVPETDFDILSVASVQPDPLDIVQAPPAPIRVS